MREGGKKGGRGGISIVKMHERRGDNILEITTQCFRTR